MPSPQCLAPLIVGLLAVYPPYAYGWVANHSPFTLYIKPEGWSLYPVELPPGLKHCAPHDGLVIPAKRGGQVYKTCDGCSVLINQEGYVAQFSCTSLKSYICQYIYGGWQSKVPWGGDPGWPRLAKIGLMYSKQPLN